MKSVHAARTSAANQRFGVGAAAIGLALLAAVLGGLMIGIELWLPLLALGGLGVASITNIGFLLKPPMSRIYLPVAIAVTLLASLVHSATRIPVGYVVEALFVCLMLPLLRALVATARHDAYFRAALFAFSGFLALAIASSFLGHSKRLAGAWQLFYDLKWVLMLAIGLMTTWDDKSIGMMRKMVKWSWLLILPFAVVEIAAPDIYAKIMSIREHVPIETKILPFLRRGVTGPFSHPGYLANVSGFLAAACLIFARREGWKWYGLPFVVYFSLLLAADQRQELMDWVILSCAILCLEYRAARYLLATIGALGAVALVVLLNYTSFDPFGRVTAQFDFTGLGNTLSERGILTLYGAKVADSYFPFGAGLGTYGGAGAWKFDQSLFEGLGFSRYWWFRQNLFLMDTYWPNFMAESGWIGAGLMLLTNMALGFRLWLLALRGKDENRSLYLLAFSGFVLMFLNTATSAMITDPRGVFVFWILIGVALRTALPATTALRPFLTGSSRRPGSLSMSS